MSTADDLTPLRTEQLNSWTFWDLARARAELGDKPLLTIGSDTLSYGAAFESAAKLAGGLTRSGISRGDRVASLGYNSTDAVMIWLACAATGAVWVPLNVSLVGGDLGYALRDSAPKLLIVDIELLERLDGAVLADARPDLVVRGAGAPGGLPTLAELADGPPAPDGAGIHPGAPMAVIYTGGSTGMPKGVLVSHTYYIGSGIRYEAIGMATPADIHYSGGHQLFHSGGQQLAVAGPMYAGMSSHMERWFSASRYWEHARDCEATIIDPIGPLMAALLRQPESALDQSHCVRLGIGTATGQIPPQMRAAFQERFSVPLLEVYSQTETGGVLICSERDGVRRLGSSGRGEGWTELGIVDENDIFLPPGQTGEIVLRPTIPNTFMIEYLNKPEQTARGWRNLWHHTGDLGYLDEDGFLFFVGRQAHWIRRRGENVSSYEVEYCILGIDGVVECAVVGLRDEEMGDEEIKAYVVQHGDASLTEPDIIDHCTSNLAYFKVPRYLEFVSELPRSGAKTEIERHVLRDRGVGNAWDRAQSSQLTKDSPGGTRHS
jgi:crotonobetaine/carnitine-CoA ligase